MLGGHLLLVDEIKKYDLRKFGLGALKPPEDVFKALCELNRDLELVWNEDDNRWEIYLVKGDTLYWQNSAPVLGSNITTGIKTWLQKFDTSKAGRLDNKDREKRFAEDLRLMLSNNVKKNQAKHKEFSYERKDIIHYLSRHFDNMKPGWISVPGPAVGNFRGKTVRLYKKRGTHKWLPQESTQESQILV